MPFRLPRGMANSHEAPGMLDSTAELAGVVFGGFAGMGGQLTKRRADSERVRDWLPPDTREPIPPFLAAPALLFKRAQFPRYWPFPTQSGQAPKSDGLG